MTAPQLTVVNSNTDTAVTTWDCGVVQANSTSNQLEILIWNNRSGTTAVADLKDANITTLANNTAGQEVVDGKWVKVNAPSMDGVWTAVGGTSGKMIRADGLSASNGNVIKGTANDGNKNTTASKQNYCTVKIKTVVPANTTAGVRDFIIRINGYWT